MSDSDETVLEGLAGLPTIAHPTVSPSGDDVALYYDVTGRNELHVVDVETGDVEQWSDGEVPRNARWFVAWGADGDRVFFHLDDAGDEQNDLYALSRDGSAEPVVEMDGQVVLQDVGEDGETILVGSNRDGQLNVYRHDLETGETTKITDYERAVWEAHLSPDGERIAYATNETDDFDNRDVYVANADGSDPRNLEIGETGAEATPADWGPDGEWLLVGDNATDLGRVGVYDLEAEDVTWYGDGEYDEQPIAVLSGGDRLLATRSRNANAVPVVYDRETGTDRELDLPEGVTSFGMGPTGIGVDEDRILLEHTSPTRRPELLIYDLESEARSASTSRIARDSKSPSDHASGSKTRERTASEPTRERDEYETLLEAEYGPFDPDDFADAEYVTFTSDGVPETAAEAVDHEPYDELEIGALLYDSGERPSPLIVNPHGGPRGRDDTSFDLYAQTLVSQGFSVLQVNYRGSTGRGREFVEELIGDWGGAEQGDVATAVEHVLERYDWLDEDRVVVFGGSYGGYSAYWQLVQYPALYDAGIAWIGLTDLAEMYETTMAHYRVELMEKYLGTPAENPDLYESRSPLAHVENLAVPICIAHGVNDRRVPVSQARLFREALEERGLEAGETGAFEYHELGEEGHASSDQAQKLRLFRLLTAFLERRADGERTDS